MRLPERAQHFGARTWAAHDPGGRAFPAQRVIDEARYRRAVARAREAMRQAPVLHRVGGRSTTRVDSARTSIAAAARAAGVMGGKPLGIAVPVISPEGAILYLASADKWRKTVELRFGTNLCDEKPSRLIRSHAAEARYGKSMFDFDQWCSWSEAQSRAGRFPRNVVDRVTVARAAVAERRPRGRRIEEQTGSLCNSALLMERASEVDLLRALDDYSTERHSDIAGFNESFGGATTNVRAKPSGSAFLRL